VKPRTQIFLIDHGTFPFDVLVCIGVPLPRIKSWCRGRGSVLSAEVIEWLLKPGPGVTVVLDSGRTIVSLQPQTDPAAFHGYVAHELLHCVDFLFRRIGIEHSSESHEAFAYQIGYLTEQFYRRLKQ
jgi:hypothetical protein